MMLVSNLAGGLGNQMFQYACARALSLDLCLPLKFTVDTLQQFDTHRDGLELDRAFGLKLDVPEHAELRRLVGVGCTHPKLRHVIARKIFSWFRNHPICLKVFSMRKKDPIFHANWPKKASIR